MFEKYFYGVIEQACERTMKEDKNVVMACYNNDFSLESLENIKRYSENMGNVFFAWREYEQEQIVGAYDPFLDVICQIYRQFATEDYENFDELLTQCEVYELHREVLNSYYATGKCARTEGVLVDEVDYEQGRMTNTIALMLKTMAEYKPIVIVVNRFHLASESTMKLIHLLIQNPSKQITVVLGAKEYLHQGDRESDVMQSLMEQLEDRGNVYHIGSGNTTKSSMAYPSSYEEMAFEKVQVQLNNIIELLDYKQAYLYFMMIEKRTRYEGISISPASKLSLYLMYVQVAISLKEFSKALDVIEEISRMDVKGKEKEIHYHCAFQIATCYMYQSKLEEAKKYALQAKEMAEEMQDTKRVFKAELLAARVEMAGWHNIFFCAKDVEVDPHLIEKLMHYNYKNHLAHMYIYAFDNRPEIVAKAYRSEAALVNFSNGVAIAKEIGNEKLVYDAYQKNVMIASTNGMNEIALLYSIRSHQFIRDNNLQAVGRTLSAIGYNLSALGHMEESGEFYERAIKVFYQLQLPEDIAEVCYNYSMTKIAQQQYAIAEEQLQVAIKIIDKLHLNSLRVANLAKLYGMQALLSTLQGNTLDAERYLLSCNQFLNSILDKQDEENLRDFEKSDDDVCVYLFAKGMNEMALGNDQEAFKHFEKSERFYAKAEGNLFFLHRLYRQKRMELFEKLDKTELYQKESIYLKQYEAMMQEESLPLPEGLLEEVRDNLEYYPKVSKGDIEQLVRQEGLAKENRRNKRQLEFISTWQKQLDVTEGRAAELVKNSVRIFLNHFNNDCAMYVRYENGVPRVLYNDTGTVFTTEKLKEFEKMIWDVPAGCAVSKISHTFLEHREMIDVFGADAICSFALVPFLKNGTVTSYLITYVKMKDNWHSSVNRYLLNEEDLNIYRLLFRELGHALNRLDYYEQISEMNKRLKETATTDTLTGITNRAGMYERIKQMVSVYETGENQKGVGVMFIDLDNFKPYNDTYGHDIGDVVLREMANIFKTAVGDMGFVSRHGGDEFIIVLYTGDHIEIERIAKRIYRLIEAAGGFGDIIERILKRKITMDDGHKISCSIGIATADQIKDEKTVDQLIQKADNSMYLVKAEGKGNYKFV